MLRPVTPTVIRRPSRSSRCLLPPLHRTPHWSPVICTTNVAGTRPRRHLPHRGSPHPAGRRRPQRGRQVHPPTAVGWAPHSHLGRGASGSAHRHGGLPAPGTHVGCDETVARPYCAAPASPRPRRSWPAATARTEGADGSGRPSNATPWPLHAMSRCRPATSSPAWSPRSKRRAARARRRAGLGHAVGWAGGPDGAGRHSAVALRHHPARRTHERPRLRRTGPPGGDGAEAPWRINRRLARPCLPRPRRHRCPGAGRAHP